MKLDIHLNSKMEMETLTKSPEVICTASYDELTVFFRTILKKYKDNNPEVLFFDFGSLKISYDEFIRQNLVSKEAKIVFAGHGTPDKLILEDTTFYDENHFKYGPKLLVAFACFAGAELGSQFAHETGGSFFGYDREIDFIDEPEYHIFGERIIHSIVKMIFDEQEINESTIERTVEIYQKVIEDLENEQTGFYTHTRFLIMLLREQLDRLCQY